MKQKTSSPFEWVSHFSSKQTGGFLSNQVYLLDLFTIYFWHYTRDTYANEAEWEEKAKDLASRFIKNFAKYEGNEAGKALVKAGPQL